MKPNLTRSETAGVGVLKRVKVTVCGMCCVDLNNDILKILGTHFSYNQKLKAEKNYRTITDIQRVSKLWKMRNLTLKVKIVIFKTIVVSKIVFQSLITAAPKQIINQLEKIQNTFLWKNSTPKIKHETL